MANDKRHIFFHSTFTQLFISRTAPVNRFTCTAFFPPLDLPEALNTICAAIQARSLRVPIAKHAVNSTSWLCAFIVTFQLLQPEYASKTKRKKSEASQPG